MEEFEMNNSPKKLQQSLEDLEKKLKTMQCNCSNTNLQFCEQCFDVLLEDSDRLENLKKSFFVKMFFILKLLFCRFTNNREILRPIACVRLSLFDINAIQKFVRHELFHSSYNLEK